MQALILAGGQGTRLRPLTLNTPKPIVPICNQPFLLRQIELLKTAGITDITLSLNYQPSSIQEILGEGAEFGVHLRYLIEPEPRGTAGAYKFAEEFLTDSTVVLNGDILTDINLQELIDRHKRFNAAATIVLISVDNPSAYGLVEVGSESEVLRFLEKPKPDQIDKLKTDTVNAGIYILEPSVLKHIPAGENYSFEYQLFPDLLARKEIFKAYIAENTYWLDIGTIERYLQAHGDLLAGKIGNIFLPTAYSQSFESVEIDEKSVVGKGCKLEPGVKIKNSVLGEKVSVGENVSIENSVIWAGTKIESDANISDSIIGFNCSIGKNASVTRGSVLGDDTNLSDFTCC